jgi:hypothetical protein
MRVADSSPLARRNGTGDDIGEPRGGGDGFLRARLDDVAGDAMASLSPSVPITSRISSAAARHSLRGAEAVRRVHAHVERTVGGN